MERQEWGGRGWLNWIAILECSCCSKQSIVNKDSQRYHVEKDDLLVSRVAALRTSTAVKGRFGAIQAGQDRVPLLGCRR